MTSHKLFTSRSSAYNANALITVYAVCIGLYIYRSGSHECVSRSRGGGGGCMDTVTEKRAAYIKNESQFAFLNKEYHLAAYIYSAIYVSYFKRAGWRDITDNYNETAWIVPSITL